jgi:hypothetical protein
MVLRDAVWLRHVEEAHLGKAKAEKQVLQRVVGGRLYTVDLEVYDGKILEKRDGAAVRDFAYSVAAELQFTPVEKPAAAPTDELPGENDPASPDAAVPAGEAATDSNS